VRAFENQLPEPVSEEYYRLFDDLSAFYIEGRYTDYKIKLSMRLDEQESEGYLRRTKEVFGWLLTVKP
jgi:HEPN domain-containing protein